MEGEERIQNQYIFTNTLVLISTFVHVIKYLIFTNRLRVFLVNTFCYSFRWQSGGYEFRLLFHNSKRSYSSSIIFDQTLICLPTIATLVLLASKPLLWLGLGLWTPKPLSQQQACLIEVFPTISITDPMVIIVVHCPIDLTQ